MTAAARERIIAEARAMLADQRYGAWTHPVILGLLLAAELVEVACGSQRS